jgi:hypothetical protein
LVREKQWLTNCSIAALTFTSPAEGAQWDLSKSNTISWSSVDNDPDSFQLVLVNHASQDGEQDSTITKNVTKSSGSYVMDNFVATPGSQYTIKAFSTSATNSGQLAESQSFNVTKSGSKLCSETSMTLYDGSADQICVAAPTTTSASTASATGSSTASASASNSATSKPNSAATLGQAFGIAGPLAVVAAMLL